MLFKALKRAIIRHRLEAQVESDKQEYELCHKAVAKLLEPPHSVIAQLWLLCRELDRRDGAW